MSFRAKNLNLQDVSSRIHKYEMNNRNVGTQHNFPYNFSQRVNFGNFSNRDAQQPEKF